MKRYMAPKDASEVPKFDVIIIGGGITGAAIAHDLTLRGISVALFDKGDFGGATSAATSKLIHGGLRYLANMEIGLVRESLKERKILADIASNFIRPLPFMLPHSTDNKKTEWTLKFGMYLYDALSFDKGWTKQKEKALPRHSFVDNSFVQCEEPEVRQDCLHGALVYYDYQNIFPERLTLAFIKTAESGGASFANYAKVVGVQRSEEQMVVEVEDLLHGTSHHYLCSYLINATGSWVDQTLNLITGKNDHNIKRSEGIHIITRKLVNKHAVTYATAEGRHFMVMPWRNLSIIGTTDREYNGDPDDYRVSSESLEQLLKNVNDYFGDGNLSEHDILYAYGGLRPLVEGNTQSSYDASRKFEILNHAKEGYPNLYTVEGGKYTTSRKLAEDVSNLLAEQMGIRMKCNTKEVQLYGSEFDNYAEFEEKLVKDYQHMFSEKTIRYLAQNYGSEASNVLELALTNSMLNKVVTPDGELLAEVQYALDEELAYTMEDVMFRRTGIGQIGKPSLAILEQIAGLMAESYGWDQTKIDSEIESTYAKYVLPN